jgi:hypothetical protein
MYGVPENLDLSPLIGATLDFIGLGKYQIQFGFNPPAGRSMITISVEGMWRALDPDGKLLDAAREHDDRVAYRVHRLLSLTVAKSALDPPRNFTLEFDTGHRLQIEDDDENYESFSIMPGNIYV